MDVLSGIDNDRSSHMGFVDHLRDQMTSSILISVGFAFAFGVFQSYYRDNELFQDSSMVAAIGTCATVSTPDFRVSPSLVITVL